jgi:hypothetical protein
VENLGRFRSHWASFEYAPLPVFNLCRGNCLSSSRTGRPNQCHVMSSALNLSRMIPNLSEQPERTSWPLPSRRGGGCQTGL